MESHSGGISVLEFKHIALAQSSNKQHTTNKPMLFVVVVVVFTHNPVSFLPCQYNWHLLLLESTLTFVLSVTVAQWRIPWQQEMLSLFTLGDTRSAAKLSIWIEFFFLPAIICWNCHLSVTVVNFLSPWKCYPGVYECGVCAAVFLMGPTFWEVRVTCRVTTCVSHSHQQYVTQIPGGNFIKSASV